VFDLQALKTFLAGIYAMQSNGEAKYIMTPILPRFNSVLHIEINDDDQDSHQQNDIALHGSSSLECATPANMFCLNERIVAAESCRFASQVSRL
jgi:hypothetical protein